jgi:hypothetical protein
LLKNGFDEEGINIILRLFKESQTLTSVCGVLPAHEAPSDQDAATGFGAAGVELCKPHKGLIDSDFSLIAAEVATNRSITTLDISSNLACQGGDDSGGDDSGGDGSGGDGSGGDNFGRGLRAICDALKNKDCRLKSIDIRRNSIGKNGGLALAEALRENDTLEIFCGIPVRDLRHGLVTKLSLSHHSLTVCELVVLAQLQAHSTNQGALKELDVSTNNLGPPCVHPLRLHQSYPSACTNHTDSLSF